MNKYFKRLLSVLLAVSILASSMCLSLGIAYGAEETDTNVVEIGNAEDLYDFAKRVNDGETSLNAVLTDDIIVNNFTITAESDNAEAWTPIGSMSNQYKGTFDGKGYTVSGLYFNDDDVSYVGLFGYTGAGAEIKNVGVINSYLRGKGYVSGICGRSSGTITGSYNTGVVYGTERYVGGIVGNNLGKIMYSYNTGAISGASSCVGGIAGYNSGTIEDSYNIGAVSGRSNSGGICGWNISTISNSFYLADTAAKAVGNDRGKTTTTAYEKSSDAFALGEVCYLLNGSVSSGEVWYQNLKEDTYPVLDESHGKVYINGTQLCPNTIKDATYTNESGEFVIQSDEHSYGSIGICSYCGIYEPASYNADTGNYEIGNYGQLLRFAALVNDGETLVNAVLTSDIIANEGIITAESKDAMVWTPIGNQNYQYDGVFDGQGHTVSGLYFNDSETYYVGLFGCTGYDAGIKNVGVINSYFNGKSYVGGICGYNYGSISNCYNTGVTNGADDNVGGICGYNRKGKIINCFNMGAVTAANSYVGGICGYNLGTISNSVYLSGTAEQANGAGVAASTVYEKSSDAFATGEVCYLLNGSVSGGEVWYQNLKEDTYPVLDKSHGKVYINGTQLCPNAFLDITYTNEIGKIEGQDNQHIYADKGFCSYCGGYEPASYNADTDNYEIGNYGQLLWFSDLVNAGRKVVNAVLTKDIIANDGTITSKRTDVMVWKPIGNTEIEYIGVFDGQGHTISGLYYVDDYSVDGVGLFGQLYRTSEVKNVGVINSYFSGTDDAGGIVGYSAGTISNCYNTGVVTGATGTSGGICGYNRGTITNSYNIGAVSNSKGQAGGITGHNSYTYGTVNNCYNTGVVTGAYAGAIVGYNSEMMVSNCYYLQGTSDKAVGKFDSGTVEATVKTSDAFASGEVCYLLNGSSGENVAFYQNISDESAVLDTIPTLDKSRGVVYKLLTRYSNTLVLGDVNCDDKLDKTDAEILLKYLSGIITEDELKEKYNADVADYNKDDGVDMLDVIGILVDLK